jgi:hypothetical protein
MVSLHDPEYNKCVLPLGPSLLFAKNGRSPASTGPVVQKGAFVAKQKKAAKLRVQSDGTQHYIDVPVGRAIDLHNFFRSNRVRSAPPEPAFTGFDRIELAKDIDIAAVQALLNNW